MTQKTFLVILTSLFLFIYSCSDTEDREKLVYDYFTAFNEGDFAKLTSCVSDSILTSEGDFILTQSINDLHTFFQWDSVFKPNYKVLELTTLDKNMEALVSKTCKRIRFLHDSATVYKVTVDFDGNKISKMETFDFVVFDFSKWQARRDTLVKWIDENHPELSGFLIDQTLKGAKKYLKAINLYESEQKKQ